MSATPTLCDAINAAVDSRIQAMHTALPGRIERYDRKRHLAAVKPLIRKRYADGSELSLPVVVNVPVVWPRTEDFEMSAPLKRGDGVLLVFAERSIDAWISRGVETTPRDTRKYDISDAIAIPGLFSTKTPSIAKTDGFELRYKGASIAIAENGTVDINGGNLAVDV